MHRALDWNTWLYGLIATVVNGFVSGVVLVIADPMHFNIYQGRSELLSVSLVMGLWGAANYLKSNPLPKAIEGPDELDINSPLGLT